MSAAILVNYYEIQFALFANMINQPVGVVVKNIAIGAESLGFESTAGQIRNLPPAATVAMFLCCPVQSREGG